MGRNEWREFPVSSVLYLLWLLIWRKISLLLLPAARQTAPWSSLLVRMLDPSPTWVEECLAGQTNKHVHSHSEHLWAVFPSFHVGLTTCSLEIFNCSGVYVVLNYSMFLQTPNVNTLKKIVKDLSLASRSLSILWGSLCCSVWATLVLYMASSKKKSASQSQAERNHDLWCFIQQMSMKQNKHRFSVWQRN